MKIEEGPTLVTNDIEEIIDLGKQQANTMYLIKSKIKKKTIDMILEMLKTFDNDYT